MEREELHLILSSGLLAKSPNLEKLLSYICEKHWEGKSDQLKEYNLGVEALGRPTDFDPAVNAIVRVEVHRLREKLKKYYENGGANHPVAILLPPGHYVPQFISRQADVPVQVDHESSANQVQPAVESVSTPPALFQPEIKPLAALASAPGEQPRRKRHGITRARFWILAAAVLGVAGVVLLHRLRSVQGSATRAGVTGADQTPPALGPVKGSGVRIIAGYFKKNYVDRSGNVWQGDSYFTGGGIDDSPDRLIARTSDATLFETDRHGEFSYNIPVEPGAYELWLYFAETLYGPGTLLGGGETSRLFSVQVNGHMILDPFDVYADAGGNFIADVRVFKDIAPAPDGEVHIRFLRRTGDPFVNAIKLTPTVPGRLQPIRIVAQDDSYTDRSGRFWCPDLYFRGGRLVLRRAPVSGTTEAGLFEGERYGNFDYAIPVAPGKYGVTLYFAERYFGPGMPGGGGVGSRVFDVTCNENVLLRNFDVFKDAGGANRALVRTFHGLVPNAQGKLMIRFLPVVNYALVDAISVVDESK
ncbi:MAG TPA: malectin domain-containing carbohydrate-binding protein [Terriglobia bacterium]|nr:malectin domain-containing carbohydrate-binding protein [Terriglobia bacterium]